MSAATLNGPRPLFHGEGYFFSGNELHSARVSCDGQSFPNTDETQSNQYE